jgi:aminopeptidase N
VSAADQADMWIHEAWATYLECLYVEHMFGYADYLKYTNAYKTKIGNKEPIITQRGIARDPNQDMYFKGALFIHTLRNIVNDDAKWFRLQRDLYDQFKFKNNFTEEIVAFVNKQLGRDLTPVFDQYLRRADLPVLELTFSEAEKAVYYRWNAAERAFAMPIRVGDPAKWLTVQPTADWKSMPWAAGRDAFKVATDLYYVRVEILDAGGRPSAP